MGNGWWISLVSVWSLRVRESVINARERKCNSTPHNIPHGLDCGYQFKAFAACAEAQASHENEITAMTARFTVAGPIDDLVFIVTLTEDYGWVAKSEVGWPWEMDGVFRGNNAWPNKFQPMLSSWLAEVVLSTVGSLKRLQAVQKRKHRMRMRST